LKALSWPNDGANDETLDFWADLPIFEHAKIGKGVTLEGQTAAQRRFADQKRLPS
jgi:hypothetical protein